jgi:hypothetical protein
LQAGAVRAPLHTLLGDHPTTHALRSGSIASPLLPLAFADVAVPNKAFKRVVRDLEFDVAELALMTFLMARSRGIPLRLLADDAQAMRELFGLFRDSWSCAGDAVDPTATPLGFEAMRSSLEVAIAVACEQGLLGRPLAVDDLVTDVLASFGKGSQKEDCQ